jgi:hypothetical protein
MEEILSEDVRQIKGNVWQRDVTIKIYDRSLKGKIDSISSDGALISICESLHQLKGETIHLLIKCHDQQTVKAAKIEWSDEWGFGAKFI